MYMYVCVCLWNYFNVNSSAKYKNVYFFASLTAYFQAFNPGQSDMGGGGDGNPSILIYFAFLLLWD